MRGMRGKSMGSSVVERGTMREGGSCGSKAAASSGIFDRKGAPPSSSSLLDASISSSKDRPPSAIPDSGLSMQIENVPGSSIGCVSPSDSQAARAGSSARPASPREADGEGLAAPEPTGARDASIAAWARPPSTIFTPDAITRLSGGAGSMPRRVASDRFDWAIDTSSAPNSASAAPLPWSCLPISSTRPQDIASRSSFNDATLSASRAMRFSGVLPNSMASFFASGGLYRRLTSIARNSNRQSPPCFILGSQRAAVEGPGRSAAAPDRRHARRNATAPSRTRHNTGSGPSCPDRTLVDHAPEHEALSGGVLASRLPVARFQHLAHP